MEASLWRFDATQGRSSRQQRLNQTRPRPTQRPSALVRRGRARAALGYRPKLVDNDFVQQSYGDGGRSTSTMRSVRHPSAYRADLPGAHRTSSTTRLTGDDKGGKINSTYRGAP